MLQVPTNWEPSLVEHEKKKTFEEARVYLISEG